MTDDELPEDPTDWDLEERDAFLEDDPDITPEVQVIVGADE